MQYLTVLPFKRASHPEAASSILNDQILNQKVNGKQLRKQRRRYLTIEANEIGFPTNDKLAQKEYYLIPSIFNIGALSLT